MFIDCFARFPSYVGDARNFRNLDIFEDVTNAPGEFFSQDEVILGDKARIQFNKKQSSARSIVERSFALLFSRFRRLRYLDMNRIESIPATILAACLLHNICLEYSAIYKYNEGYIQEGIEYVVGNTFNINEMRPSAWGKI